MTCDILIVSYWNDLSWLSYNLQFLNKNWKTPGRIIVRLEENCRHVVEQWGVTNVEYYYIRPWPDGYCFAMWEKLNSPDYSDADFLLLIDSDIMLIEPASLEDQLEDGKPIVYYHEWDQAPGDVDSEAVSVSRRIWGAALERSMGVKLDKEYMIYHPFLYYPSTFHGVRRMVVDHKRQNFLDAVYSAVPFSAETFLEHHMPFVDYEALSFYAANFQADRYALRKAKGNYTPWEQYWSHGGFTPEIQAFLDQKLKE